jgi:hypothetical protein
VNEQVTAEEMRQLLRAYAVALDTADSLPSLVRIASRPRRWTVLEPLRRMPRHTIGTSTMTTHHVQRSTATLARRYARIAATRGLTDEDEQASELVARFRESLTEVRWRFIVPALVIAAVGALQIVARSVAAWTWGLTYGLLSGLNEPDQKELTGAVRRATSSIFKPDAFIDLFSEIGKTGFNGLYTLANMVIVAAYLVFRPLSPAFRIKRILFNLAPTGRIDLARTTTTWNLPRSAGLYDLERTLFARLGARPPNEINMDLWLGAIAAVVLAQFGSRTAVGIMPIPDDTLMAVVFLVLSVGLGVARVIWLRQTAMARRRNTGLADPPGGFVVPCAERVVESRSVLEAASLGAVFWLPTVLFLPLLPWVRLVRERRDLDRAYQRALGSRGRLPSPRVWTALGSAVLLWLLPPIAVAIHLTRLMRLQPPGVGSARRTRAWLVPLATTGFPLYFWVLPLQYNSFWIGGVLAAQCASFAVVIGAIQHEHNALARHIGTPLRHDDPLWDRELTHGAQHQPVMVRPQGASNVTLPQPEG